MDMNTLDELIYYCEEKEPVGALMLIGEWGCGKTYLIEHELSDKLKESHIIIRVSLFGISSVEAVAAIVKQSWTDASLNDKGAVVAWANKAAVNLKKSLLRLQRQMKLQMLFFL